MEKLNRLSGKEETGEQNLSGMYRITMDVNIAASKNWTVNIVKEQIQSLGEVDDFLIEKHADDTSPFTVGESIELLTDFSCEKTAYLDTFGNLVISDKPVQESVERVGDFKISLVKGTIAEINSPSKNGQTEVLFTGESVLLDELGRVAYLGILEVPSDLIIKSGV